MPFSEINLFGVYVAPIALLAVSAWIVTIVLRRIAVRLQWLGQVWHPAVFVLSMYVIVLSSIILVLAWWSRHV